MEEDKKKVLGLQLPTDPRWVNIAEMDLEGILTDHAYCEQKAASSGITLIIKFHDHPLLVETLSPIVTEEWEHFQMVMDQLKKRGLSFGPPRKDDYVIGLMQFNKKGGSREDYLTEKLLTNALIEARSCERFRLLSKFIEDKELKEFYHQLMVSEAGHYKTFIKLAKFYNNPEYVEKRWKEFLDFEAELLGRLEIRADRMH